MSKSQKDLLELKMRKQHKKSYEFFLKTDPTKVINMGSEDMYKNSYVKERTWPKMTSFYSLLL